MECVCRMKGSEMRARGTSAVNTSGQARMRGDGCHTQSKHRPLGKHVAGTSEQA